jgi:6-phosphofructokinase 1
MRMAVLTSGGDAPGMNAAIHTVVKAGIAREHEVLGVRGGYEGLMRGDVTPFRIVDVDDISRVGGTILGSARALRFREREGRADAIARMGEAGIEGLVVIGGNGSLAGAHALAGEAEVPVVGVPASIDNDIGHTALAIGVDTAVNTIVEACDRIADTARAHRRVFVVEVMGRDSGFLAMRAGIAAEADAIVFNERGLDEAGILDHLREVVRRAFDPGRGKRRVLVIKAEGVSIATSALVRSLESGLAADGLEVEVRETILGHVVRGGSPTAIDRMIAQRLGFGAVRALERGATDLMLGWDVPGNHGEATGDPRVRRVPLADVLEETRSLLDGSSPLTRGRVALLEQVEDILGR